MDNTPESFAERLSRLVDRFGLTSIHVPAFDEAPAFAFTIGLSTSGKYDFLVVGHEHSVVKFIFYRIWELVEQDRIFGAGKLVNVIHDMSVDLVEVDPGSVDSLLRSTVITSKLKVGRVLQIVLPDDISMLEEALAPVH